MSKPKPPAPPNYAAAATAQGTANEGSAIATNFLNQANQVGPNGSLTYTYDPTKGMKLPDGTVIPQTTATTVLSPAQQKLLDQQNGISASLNDLAAKGVGYVGNAVANPLTADSVKGTPLSTGLARTSFSGAADPTKLGIQGTYNFSKVGTMPNAADFQGQRDQITNAMMARLQPSIDRDRAALDVRDANQGITHGSEAYGTDYNIFNQGVNDQRIAALLAGDNEQQNLFQNAMGIRQQGVGEAEAQGNFGNAAQGQQFGQNQQALENKNAAAQATFAQGLASDQFANQARTQAIQEADYFQNQPLNMLSALRTGNAAQIPQFGSVTAGANIAPAPVYAAAGDQYNAAMQAYQAKLASQNAAMQGVAGLGGAAMSFIPGFGASDRRIKKNIEYLWTRLDGLCVYAFDFIFGGKRQIGVMADEVARLRPDALGPVIGGIATVNYKVLRNG